MILSLLVAAAVTSSAPLHSSPARNLISGAQHAIRVDRLDQAKLMLARAVAAGASGPALEHALADLAYALGKNDEALARYLALLQSAPTDQSLLEPAGIAALDLGKYEEASALLSRATSASRASWRAWNALGVAADFRRDWNLADRCYAMASSLAPKQVGPVNNHGWSLILRGEWKEAEAVLQRAAVMDPKSKRITDNLELVRAALSSDLPERRTGETAASWAARLNDAGVAAVVIGDRTRATAAFTQAIQASDTWYPRAANNLEAIGDR